MTLEIDHSTTSALLRDAAGEVEQIRNLLDDVYKDAGDGRTIVRELVQNADDAEATQLTFALVSKGLATTNSLLAGPALLVFNDGPFEASHQEGIRKAIGGSKRADEAKVGRFGLGLKSVFHLAEAFLFLGSDGEKLRPGVVNPWAETAPQGAHDPLHGDWDGLTDGEVRQMAAVAEALGARDHGYLLLWIPLRQPGHLDRYVGGGGIRDRPVEPGDVRGWFDSETSLSLLLPQCRHLVEVEFRESRSCSTLESAESSLYVRKEARRGRPWRGTAADESEAEFSCRISTRDGRVLVEAVGLQQLRHSEGTRAQTERADWPKDDVAATDGSHRRERVPRKAIPHGAVTLVRRLAEQEPKGDVFLRWSVFLPLDDSVRPSSKALASSQVLRREVTRDEHPTWDLLLHGYFWPSQDRRSVPGLVNVDGGPSSKVAVREGWNLAVGRDIVVPLLPKLLAQAVANLPVRNASGRIRAVTRLIEGETRSSDLQQAMVSETWLMPVLLPDGVTYRAVPAGTDTIALRDWDGAPSGVREPWHRAWASWGFVARDEQYATMGGTATAWPDELWDELLEQDGEVDWSVAEHLGWLERVVREEVRRRRARDLDMVRAAMIRWFGRAAARGLFEVRTDVDDQAGERKRLRAGVVGIACAVSGLPTVGVPVGAAAAVRELSSTGGLEGIQAVVLPVGAAANDVELSPPDESAIRSLLLAVGQRLRDEPDVTKTLRQSWLTLASALVALIPEQSLKADRELAELPLLPVTRFPDDDAAALTFSDLETARQALRVFSREGDVRDPKKALSELASTLGEPCWMLPDHAEWAEAFRISPISATALAEAVLCGDRDLASNDEALGARKRLAKRTLDQPQGELPSPEESARKAARLLLCGQRSTPSDAPLYRLPQPASRELESTARVVLSIVGLEHTLIPATLTGGLTADQLDLLGVDALDARRLRARAKSVLEAQPAPSLAPEQWLSIVRATYEAEDEFAQHEWKALPIHRTVDGMRTSVTDRTLRSRGEELPAELHDDAILLEPEPEVARYYFDVPKQDAKGVVRLALATVEPWKHWSLIIDLVASENAYLGTLSDEWATEVGQALHDRPWLPESAEGLTQNQALSGLRPSQLALLPDPVAEAARPFVVAGCTGEVRLPEAVAADAWPRCEPLVRGLIEACARLTPIERLVGALTLADAGAATGSLEPAALGIASRDGSSLGMDHLQTGMRVLQDHSGWALLRAVADACPEWEECSDSAPFRLKTALATALLDGRDARALVAPLAKLEPGKATPERDLLFGYLRHFHAQSSFWTEVLPEIKLPTKAGTWAFPEKIARSQHGLRPEQLLVRDAWDALGVDDQAPLERTPDAGHAGMRAGERLRMLFAGWDGSLPSAAVGSFLALLGNGRDNLVSQVAAEWLKKDGLTTETVRAHLVDGVAKPHAIAQTLVYVRIVKAEDATVQVPNLLGREVHFSLAEGRPSLLAADPQLQSGLIRHWKLLLRAIDPSGLDHTELVDTLGRAAVDIAVRLHKLPRERVKAWWSERVASSQVAVGPIRRLILDDIPLVLAQLDVRDDRDLTEQLVSIDRLKTQKQLLASSQEKQRQSIDRRIGTAFRRIEKRLETDDALQRFLLERVRARITDFRYSPQSVLLELIQNADDALVQLQEAKGEELLPEAARRVEIVLRQGEGGPVLEFTHWGRCINDSWSEEFEGRGWDRDLYNMLLMNLSVKPGHDSSGGPSTTGKFGLGFKSVHLVTHRPTVFSGFIRFSVHGGLLPFETEEPWPEAYTPVGGFRPTTIRLPLDHERSEVGAADENGDVEVVDQIMARFRAAAPYLPAFSRGVKEVCFRGLGGEFDVSATFEGVPGAPGWSVTDQAQRLGVRNDGTIANGRLLRFQVDAELDQTLGGVFDRAIFGCSLVVAIGDAGVVPLPESVSSLWCLAPTSAHWDLGYIVNGPFELDAGRWGIAVDGQQTLRVARRFGTALCDGLKRLHDAVMDAPARHDSLLGQLHPLDLLGQVWRVLAPDPRRREPPTRKFLDLLHGETRGAAGWAASRGVVPTELPAPFLSHLDAGTKEVRVAADALVALAGALRSATGLLALCHRVPLVSSDIFVRLTGRDPIPGEDDYGLAELLSDWLETKQRRVAAADLDELKGLSSTSWPRWVAADGPVEFKNRAGRWAPAHELLFVTLPGDGEDPDVGLPVVEEEIRRAAFAPDSRCMAAEYGAMAERAGIAHRLRGQLAFKVADLVSWVSVDAIRRERKVAALRYLVAGQYGREFADLVKRGDAPAWMRDREEIHALTATGWSREDQARVLFELFGAPYDWDPGRDDDTDEEPPVDDHPTPPPVLSDEVATKLLKRLWEMLSNDAKRREIDSAHHERWYPAKWRSPGALRTALLGEAGRQQEHEAWMVLFVLGTAQRLGRTQPMQHRGFIEQLQASTLTKGGRTWWDALFGLEAGAESWFCCLEEWASRRHHGSAAFEHWFTLLPELFAAWRWSDDYVDVLSKLDRRQSIPPDFMATRTDPDQQLGGVDAPAIPSFRVSWAVRELLRLGVLRHTGPLGGHCLPRSRKLETVLQLLGQRPSETSWECLVRLVGEERARMHGLYDVALLSSAFQSLLAHANQHWTSWTRENEEWDDEGSGDLGSFGANEARADLDEERRQAAISALRSKIEKLEERIPKFRAFDRDSTPTNERASAAERLRAAEAALREYRSRLGDLLDNPPRGAQE